MRIKSLFIAVALVFAAVQANAATYNAIFKLDRLSTFCWSPDCSHLPDSLTKYFNGFKAGQGGNANIAITEAVDGQSINFRLSYGPNLEKTLINQTLNLKQDGTYLYDTIDTVLTGYRNIVSWDGTSGYWWHEDDGYPVEYYAMFTFELATVPLPASAALLPLGIAALGAMRKRRKALA